VTTVTLRDVTLRDGLQTESVVVTADKLAVFEALVGAGVRDLELVSFVRPDRVPAMADAAELAAATAGARADAGVDRWALVLNQRGAERAVAAGMDRLQFVVSVSEEHSRRNAGRSVDAALGELEAIAGGLPGGTLIEVTLATAFGCPYQGPTPHDDVLAAAERSLEAGAAGLSLADTIGTAIPSEVTALVKRTKQLATDRVPVGAHLHDTRGLGIANALSAIDAGANRIDGTVGGLGGCPFAPGASGNMALEDLVHVLGESGVDTGIDIDALLDVAHLACTLVGREAESHLARAGPRFRNLADATADAEAEARR
jgi:hydroxymethylglutaryl-CoA lyase